jgi:hypothetical protein
VVSLSCRLGIARETKVSIKKMLAKKADGTVRYLDTNTAYPLRRLSTIFFDVTPCSPVVVYRHLARMNCYHLWVGAEAMERDEQACCFSDITKQGIHGQLSNPS